MLPTIKANRLPSGWIINPRNHGWTTAAEVRVLRCNHHGESSLTRAIPPLVIIIIPTDVVDLISPVQQRTQSAPVLYVNGRPGRRPPTKILVIQRVVWSQQMQVVCQLPRTSEVADVNERMRRCYGLVLSSLCTHHDRNYFMAVTVTDILEWEGNIQVRTEWRMTSMTRASLQFPDGEWTGCCW